MKLLTKTVARTIPLTYAASESPDPVAFVKFFTSWSGWTWYVCEGMANLNDGTELSVADGLDHPDLDDIYFFGKVIGLETELGDFSLKELASLKGPGGLTVERDLYFRPTKLSECE